MELFVPYSLPPVHFAFVATHVVSALAALAFGPLAMVTRKGGTLHRRAGLLYLIAMLSTNLTALALLIWRFNGFLLGVTLLALYGVLTGYRITRVRQRISRGEVPTLDWGLAWVAVATGALLALLGALTLAGIAGQAIPSGGPRVIAGLLPLVFGLLVFKDGRTDLGLLHQAERPRRWWWFYHMERMLGSYVALVTALMVQQVGEHLPPAMAWIVWVAPVLIGSFAIGRWITRDRARFAAQDRLPISGGETQAQSPIYP